MHKVLSPRSINQMFDVLTKFRIYYERRYTVDKAYQNAVEDVRKKYGVAYQTIGDLCRRRLELKVIREFYNLLGNWVAGNASPLISVLMAHTREEDHPKISDYFNQQKPKSHTERTAFVRSDEETFTFRLDGDAAKKLKILSIESGSPSEWLSQVVSEVVDRRYKDWLNDQLGKETGGKEL